MLDSLNSKSVPEKALALLDLRLDLLSNPPKVEEQIVEFREPHESPIAVLSIPEEHVSEGKIIIGLCQFSSGKYKLMITAKVKGEVLKSEKELTDIHQNDLSVVQEKVKYVLLSSRNILKNYYLRQKTESIENHLKAFILPII